MDHVPQVNQRRLAVLLALLALVSMLFSMGAHAAGKKIITNKDVVMDNLAKEMHLPVKVADRTVGYPIMKRISNARMASAMRLAMSGPAGAAATIAGLILLDYNASSQSGSLSYTTNEFYFGEKYAGTWFAGSGYTGVASCAGQVFSAVYSCMVASQTSYWTGMGYTSSGFTVANTSTTVKTINYQTCAGGTCTNRSMQAQRSSSSYPPGYTQPVATDEQLGEAVRGYDTPNDVKDLFADQINKDIINQAPHEPISLSQESIDQINEAIRTGVDTGLDAFEEEMAKWGREHNVTIPDPTSVPEADTDNDGDSETSVTVNVTVENPNPEEDDTASGGEDCTAPPSCSGQQIQCMQAYQQWRTRCVDPPTEEELMTAIGATDAEKGLEPGPNDGSFVADDLDDSSFISGVACPVAPSFTVNVVGQSKTISMEELWEPACYMADKFAPFVLAMAYLSAALLLFRSFGGA